MVVPGDKTTDPTKEGICKRRVCNKPIELTFLADEGVSGDNEEAAQDLTRQPKVRKLLRRKANRLMSTWVHCRSTTNRRGKYHLVHALTLIAAARNTSGYDLHILTANISMWCRTVGRAVRPCTGQNHFAMGPMICTQTAKANTLRSCSRVNRQYAD